MSAPLLHYRPLRLAFRARAVRNSAYVVLFFFFQAEDGIRDLIVTGVQTCALPISNNGNGRSSAHSPSCRCRCSGTILRAGSAATSRAASDSVSILRFPPITLTERQDRKSVV